MIKKKKIILTDHAKRRMAKRGVREKQVRETIFYPDKPYLPGELDEETAIKRFGNREIRIVFEETKRNVIIVYSVISKPLRK